MVERCWIVPAEETEMFRDIQRMVSGLILQLHGNDLMVQYRGCNNSHAQMVDEYVVLSRGREIYFELKESE